MNSKNYINKSLCTTASYPQARLWFSYEIILHLKRSSSFEVRWLKSLPVGQLRNVNPNHQPIFSKRRKREIMVADTPPITLKASQRRHYKWLARTIPFYNTASTRLSTSDGFFYYHNVVSTRLYFNPCKSFKSASSAFYSTKRRQREIMVANTPNPPLKASSRRDYNWWIFRTKLTP